jgi:acyl CoA:acetate/3-ketoacid CoA transferase beta subunit
MRCTYPLTAGGCIKRVYTDLATLACTPDGFELIDVACLTPSCSGSVGCLQIDARAAIRDERKCGSTQNFRESS